MKIILTSTNKAKIEATEKVVKKLFLNANVESMDVETGVSKTLRWFGVVPRTPRTLMH